MSQAKCTLIGDQTDDAVQLLLGLVALSSLYAKWHFESPRRPAQVWFMDAMKQGTSAAMIHVLNIVFAIGIVDYSDRPSDEDECAFYFMNVVIDTTLGVYIAYLLVQLVTWLSARFHWSKLQYHGYYGSPPSWRVWAVQLAQWCAILIVMKLLVGVAIWVFSSPLSFLGSVLFYPVHGHPKVELLIVMIGCPLVMNMVQFWIQDSFLMDRARDHGEALPLLHEPAVDPSELLSVHKDRSVSSTSSSAADMRTHPRETLVHKWSRRLQSFGKLTGGSSST